MGGFYEGFYERYLAILTEYPGGFPLNASLTARFSPEPLHQRVARRSPTVRVAHTVLRP